MTNIKLKKTVVYVSINCKKCKAEAMKAVAKLSDVNKIEVDAEKNTVTVIGEVDPIEVVKMLRKVNKMAQLMTAGSETEGKEEKKNSEVTLPDICGTCDSISVTYLPTNISPIECSIL